MTRDRYPALDGIRGLALVLVIIFHVNRLFPPPSPSSSLPARMVAKAAEAGWCGVELFFVLSGFLITSGLIAAQERGDSTRHFYVRRVVRIAPAYYAFLLVLLAAAPLIATVPGEIATLRANQPWYWVFLVDVLVFRNGWAATPLHSGHLWSIAIEAHYYLLWPVAVGLLDRRRLRVLCGALFLASSIGRAILLLAGSPAAAVYAFTPTHLEGLAAGGWLALAHPRLGSADHQRWCLVLAAGAGVLGFVALATTRATLQPNDPVATLVGIPCAAVIAAGVVGLLPFERALSLPILTTVGRYSYAAYLYHDPIVLLTWRSLAGPPVAVFLAVATLTAVASAISWVLVERPAAMLRERWERSRAERCRLHRP